MEEELQDSCAAQRQHCFEVVYEIIPLRPDRVLHELVHPNHENIFIVGSIEDYHLAFTGRAEVSAPQKIVSSLIIVRLLESEDKRPLRVHSAEDVPDDAVLAGGVEDRKSTRLNSSHLGISYAVF